MLAWWLALLAVLAGVGAGPQSNYNLRNLDVEFEEGEGIPEFGTLDGIVTELDTISSSIKLSRTNASLNCASGYMHIDLKFQQKFFGIVYAQKDRNSACKVAGKGEESAKIDIPLKGCGTVQENTRVFKNDIVVRFHPGLEIEGDEVITVICRYPPPVVQPPVIPLPVQLPEEAVLALQRNGEGRCPDVLRDGPVRQEGLAARPLLAARGRDAPPGERRHAPHARPARPGQAGQSCHPP